MVQAVKAGVVKVGQVTEVILGRSSRGRPDPRRSLMLLGSVLRVDVDTQRLTVAVSDLMGISVNATVRLAFGVSSGLYVARGVVRESTQQGRAASLVVRLGPLRSIQQRRSARVSIPGSRASCHMDNTVLDCPVVDVSANGMCIEGPEDLECGNPLTINLFVPLVQPLKLTGSVVWIRVTESGSRRVGITFKRLDPASKVILATLCLFYNMLPAAK